METSEDDADKKRVEIITEANTRTAERAKAYANLVVFGGYAGAFTLWNFTRDKLSPAATILVAFLLGGSLAVFVFFEVYKTAMDTIHGNKFSKLVQKKLPAAEFLIEVDKIRDAMNAQYWRTWHPTWAFCWTFSVVTALSAVAILFYDFFAILIGLPLWP